jgi:hypothetical protein
MAGQKGQITAKQEQFAKLVVEGDASFSAAYRIVYPPRYGKRSPVAERVAARRVAHHPLVERRMEELRNQLRAGDPVELRRRANAILGGILGQEVDPRYRRAALDTLRYLDQQEREQQKAERESLRMAMAEVALLDAIVGRGTDGRAKVRQRLEELRQVAEEASMSAGSAEQPGMKPEGGPDPEADRRRAEVDQVIADRQRTRMGGRI